MRTSIHKCINEYTHIISDPSPPCDKPTVSPTCRAWDVNAAASGSPAGRAPMTMRLVLAAKTATNAIVFIA